MAIFDGVAGIECVICVNGVPVEEFEDASEVITGPAAASTVVKYIMVKSGDTYTIEHRVHPTYPLKNHLAFLVTVDGNFIGQRTLWTNDPGRIETQTMIDDGFASYHGIGLTVVKSFKFADVDTIEIFDDEVIARDMQEAEGIGEIVVSCLRTTKPRLHTKARTSARKIMPDDEEDEGEAQTVFAEKALKKKGISHRTTQGEETRFEKHTYQTSTNIDELDKPLIKFVFKYKSKVALQRQLIIPRTPTPDPLDIMSPEEMRRQARELRRRLRPPSPDPFEGLDPEELKRQTREMRDKLRDIDLKPLKKEKREREEEDYAILAPLARSSKRPKVLIDPSLVIDLSDD